MFCFVIKYFPASLTNTTMNNKKRLVGFVCKSSSSNVSSVVQLDCQNRAIVMLAFKNKTILMLKTYMNYNLYVVVHNHMIAVTNIMISQLSQYQALLCFMR